MTKKTEFIDLRGNIYYIEDIERCERRLESFDKYNKELKADRIYAILKNREEVLFNYCFYEKLLESHQRLSEDKKIRRI